MHMQIRDPIYTHTLDEWTRGWRERMHANNSPEKDSSIYIFYFKWKSECWCLPESDEYSSGWCWNDGGGPDKTPT